MAIQARGLPMCRPPCVGNTSVRVKDLGHVWVAFFDELLELSHLADLFECKDLILLVAIDG